MNQSSRSSALSARAAPFIPRYSALPAAPAAAPVVAPAAAPVAAPVVAPVAAMVKCPQCECPYIENNSCNWCYYDGTQPINLHRTKFCQRKYDYHMAMEDGEREQSRRDCSDRDDYDC